MLLHRGYLTTTSHGPSYEKHTARPLLKLSRDLLTHASDAAAFPLPRAPSPIHSFICVVCGALRRCVSTAFPLPRAPRPKARRSAPPSFAVCVRKWHGGEERVRWRREERGGCLRRGGESPQTIGLWGAINALVFGAAAWLFCCSLLIGGLRDKSVCVHNNSVVVVCLVVTSWGEMIYAYNEGIILFFIL